ncbi:hypothetical protein BDQ17DRAFT_90529 [Cyathus striatus]|nr:hypothetical protein BDQ17DRAFT_90529 [Cyathus striatus]
MKLPAFYLLDAISKNVYEPYARHFTSFVIPLFLETYSQVDESTRSKMEEMLLTWRSGSPNGKELFGVPSQVAIERGVWGDGQLNNSGYPGQISKAQVLSELQFILSQKERAIQVNPYDTVSRGHVSVLHQLRKLVETGVSQDELQQILNQLRSLARTAVSPMPNVPPVPVVPTVPPSQWSSSVSVPPVSLSAISANATGSIYPPYVQDNHGFKEELRSSELCNVPTISSNAAAAPSDISNLLSTLIKAGVVSASGTPVGAGSSTKQDILVEDPVIVTLKQESERKYREAILSQNAKLSSLEITRTIPPIVQFLYDSLSAQCKQCGIRFPDSAAGKKTLDDHLDMHFRQNRKATQNIGRGHSRSWFIGVEDWIHEVDGDVKGKGRERGSYQNNNSKTSAMDTAKRDAELRSQFVVVPPGDEAKAISCPICKEPLKSEFLEDDEEWVWKNAVLKDDRVYHATCHAEAIVSTSSLAARLKTEGANDSRGGTPERQLIRTGMILRGTPPPSASRLSKSKSPSLSPSPEVKLAGTKRKVEPSDASSSTEPDGTPPLKKMAMTAA